MDAIDSSGDQQLSVEDNIFKIRLDETGASIGEGKQDVVNDDGAEGTRSLALFSS